MNLRGYMEQLNKGLESLKGYKFKDYKNLISEYDSIVKSIFNHKEFKEVMVDDFRIKVNIPNVDSDIIVFEVIRDIDYDQRYKYSSNRGKVVNIIIEKHKDFEEKYLDMEIKEFIHQYQIDDYISYIEFHKNEIKRLQDKILENENDVKRYEKELEKLKGGK